MLFLVDPPSPLESHVSMTPCFLTYPHCHMQVALFVPPFSYIHVPVSRVLQSTYDYFLSRASPVPAIGQVPSSSMHAYSSPPWGLGCLKNKKPQKGQQAFMRTAQWRYMI
ncbi:hypothetical protein ACJBU6_10469 [Exserohilum turcicum]